MALLFKKPKHTWFMRITRLYTTWANISSLNIFESSKKKGYGATPVYTVSHVYKKETNNLDV